jgi:hypothetical protein
VKAALSRGANFSEFWSNKRLYARILGMTMLSAIEQSERLVKSMEARGYNGDITLYGDVSRPPIHELFFVVFVVSFVASAATGAGETSVAVGVWCVVGASVAIAVPTAGANPAVTRQPIRIRWTSVRRIHVGSAKSTT